MFFSAKMDGTVAPRSRTGAEFHVIDKIGTCHGGRNPDWLLVKFSDKLYFSMPKKKMAKPNA
jgi:hypothetical protein